MTTSKGAVTLEALVRAYRFQAQLASPWPGLGQWMRAAGLTGLIEAAFAFCSRCSSSKEGKGCRGRILAGGRRGRGACLVTISCKRLQDADRAIIATVSPMRRVGGLEKERWSWSGMLVWGWGEGLQPVWVQSSGERRAAQLCTRLII